MEPVEHIFKLPDNEIKSDSESLTTARDSCAGWVAFVKTLQTAALGLPTEQPWAGKQLKSCKPTWRSGVLVSRYDMIHLICADGKSTYI